MPLAISFLSVKKWEKLKGMSVEEWVNKGMPIQGTSPHQGSWKGVWLYGWVSQTGWWGSLVSMHNYTVKGHQAERVQSLGVWACSAVVEVTQPFAGSTQFAKHERKITSNLSCAISSYSVTEQNAFRSAMYFSFLFGANYSLKGSCQSSPEVPSTQKTQLLPVVVTSHITTYIGQYQGQKVGIVQSWWTRLQTLLQCHQLCTLIFLTTHF